MLYALPPEDLKVSLFICLFIIIIFLVLKGQTFPQGHYNSRLQDT